MNALKVYFQAAGHKETIGTSRGAFFKQLRQPDEYRI
jgi:hypothetical protein